MMNCDLNQKKVGIVVKQFGAQYFGRMLDGAVDYLSSVGINHVVRSGNFSSEGEYGAIEALLNEGCDGLIIQSDYINDDTLHDIFEKQPNVVFMNRYLDRCKDRCVFVDNYSAAQKSANYLVQNGHSKIAMVCGPSALQDTQIRKNGFVDELSRHGLTIPPKLMIESDFGESGGKTAMQELLNANTDFTAVYFQNDTMAISAMSYCRSASIRIPEDISILGFDDQVLARLVTPGLTTMRQPLRKIGERSGQLMHELLTNATKRGSNEFKLKLIERDSACALGEHEDGKDKKVRLSAREVECLHWTSKGKTAYEISIILGISENTVVFHLRKAGKKLNTVNRTHLVAKAIFDLHLLAK